VVLADGGVIVRVRGELDMTTAGELERAVSAACACWPGLVVLDVSQVTLMDAAGLRPLVRLWSELPPDRRSHLVVQGASGVVRRVFQLSGTSFLLADDGAAAPDPAGARSGT
jgi:anti-sigma B factor antagonist